MNKDPPSLSHSLVVRLPLASSYLRAAVRYQPARKRHNRTCAGAAGAGPTGKPNSSTPEGPVDSGTRDGS